MIVKYVSIYLLYLSLGSHQVAVVVGSDSMPAMADTFIPLTGQSDDNNIITTDPEYEWVQVAVDIDGPTDTQKIGQSIALNQNGSRVAVGGYPQVSTSYYEQYDTGKVLVYDVRSNGNGWVKVGQTLKTESNEDNDEFGRSIGMSYDGTRLVIGAPRHNSGNPVTDDYKYGEQGGDYGRVYIYELLNDLWVELDRIDGVSENARNGESVSMSADGRRVAMGSGRIRVFEDNGNGPWVQVGSTINRYVSSLCISPDGTRIAGGELGNDVGNLNAGYLFVFEYDGSDWVQVGADIYGDGDNEFLGRSISLSYNGSILAGGGDRYCCDYGSYAGRVKAYEMVNGAWTQIGSDIISNENGFTGSSISLSAAGTRIAVGSTHNNVGTRFGDVTVFDFVDDEWAQIGNFIQGEYDGDYFGGAVALSPEGEVVAGGSEYNSDAGFWRGHVRVFALEDVSVQCLNSLLPIYLDDGTFIPNCAEAAQGGYCDTSTDVQSHCPKQCDTCDTYKCSDSEATVNDNGATCASLQNLPIETIEFYCDVNRVYRTCRGTCNYCQL